MELTQSLKKSLLPIWREKRVVSICFFVGLAQFQYGYDYAAVAGFQGMLGFLIVFGYEDVCGLNSTMPFCPCSWNPRCLTSR